MPYLRLQCPRCHADFGQERRFLAHLEQEHGVTDHLTFYLQERCGGTNPTCECSPGCDVGLRWAGWKKGFTSRFARGHNARSTDSELVKPCLPVEDVARPSPAPVGPTYASNVLSFADDVAVQEAYSADVVGFARSLGVDVVPGGGPSADLTFDAWFPEKRLGVDVHDLSGGRPTIYGRGHLRGRLVAARATDVRYVQFFSDEWVNKGAICRSIVANAAGSTATKLHARDCEVRVVVAKDTKPFLVEMHLQGATRASDHVVLVHPHHGIVGVVTVRTPIQKKYGNVCELARLAFRPGFSVRGGPSKMLSVVHEIAKGKGFEGVLSYSDLRIGTGGVYVQCGYDLVGETTTNYHYTDGIVRYDRFKYRAQPGKPEKQVVAEAGVRPVWGAGHRIYLLKLVPVQDVI